MKAPLLVGLSVILTAASAAWACPPPPPMRSTLQLVTTATTTIPGDGGVLVQHGMEMDFDGRGRGDGDAALTVRVKGGATLTPQVDDFADGLERWRFPTTVERDLEVIGSDGAVIATLHQLPGGVSLLPTPRIKKLTSTARRGDGDASFSRPPSHMVLDLATAAPTRATTLIAQLVDGEVGWFTAARPAGRRIVRDTYGGKSCSGGPAPLVAGTRLRFAWLDANGRRSAWTKPITVAYVAPRP